MNTKANQLLKIYTTMVTIRKFEEAVEIFFKKGIIRGSFHPSIGEEGIIVGATSALRNDDYVVSYHRCHGAAIAKGSSPKRIMAELFGKEGGCCKGLGGSMHITDVSVGFLGGNGIVGGGIPHAAGAALASKILKNEKVTICFFGEGASNQGIFHETLNMAALWNLPVVYICQNNQIAVTTFFKGTTLTSVAKKGESYNIYTETVNGFDVLAVREVTLKAVEEARKGNGPILIESLTERFTSHSMGIKEVRERKYMETLRASHDPISNFKHYLIGSKKSSESELIEIEKSADSIIKEAIKYAEEAPEPSFGLLMEQ